MAGVVVFLSDFGMEDEFVGVCHAVVAARAPGVGVIDLTHGVPPGDVRRGALALRAAVPYLPERAVVLAVVDPGVGTSRRAVALRAGSHSLVGPDNGLLSAAWQALGGVDHAVQIDPGRVSRGPVSATFHGRDVFAPAAARLASGSVLEDLGDAVDPASLRVLDLPAAGVEPGAVRAEVIGIDRFGNVQLGATGEDLRASGLAEAPGLALRHRQRQWACRPVRTFADLGEGELGVLEDSAGWLAVVLRGGGAADRTGLRAGDDLLLSLRPWDSAS